MKEQQWTKEPWAAHGAFIEDTSGRRVNVYDNDPANRTRIVACVNALANVPDPEAYRTAADGLREAVKKVVAWLPSKSEDGGWGGPGDPGWANGLEAAIKNFDAARGAKP